MKLSLLACTAVLFFNAGSLVFSACDPHGIGNQFLDIPHVSLNAICYLPKVVGPCRARFPRYYYNKFTKRCEFFYYGGCRGNKNNFKSLKACNRKCYSICYLPKVVGPCRARFPRYYYNKFTKRCEFFYYGGCRGNKNNFKSLKACNRKCYYPPVKG